MSDQIIDKLKFMTKVQAKVLTDKDVLIGQKFTSLYNHLNEKEEIQLIKKISTIIYNSKTGSSFDSVKAFGIFDDAKFLNIQSTNFENSLILETFNITYSSRLNYRFHSFEYLKENKLSNEEIKEFNLLKFQLSHLNDLLKEKTMKATVKNLTALRLVINSIAHNYNISNLDVIRYYHNEIDEKLPYTLNLIQSIYNKNL